MAKRLDVFILEKNKKVLDWLLTVLDINLFSPRVIHHIEEFGVKNAPGNASIFILGLPLTGLTNQEALEQTIHRIPEIPVVVLFDSASDNEILDCIRGGAQGFIRMETLGNNLVTSVIYQAYERQGLINKEKKSKLILQNLIRNLPGFIYRSRKDENWTIEYLSDGFEALTGFSPADFIQNKKKMFEEIIHPDDQDRVWKEAQRVIKKGGNFEMEYRIITADQNEKWVWERGNFSGDKSPNDLFDGFITDITEKKYHENLMQLLTSIGEMSNQSIYASDFLTKTSQIIKNVCKNGSWAFLLPIPGTSQFTIDVATGNWENYADNEFDVNNSPYSNAFLKNRILFFDQKKDKKIFNRDDQFILAGERYFGLIPLISQNIKIALLIASRRIDFSEQEINILKTISEMITRSIERADLYQKAKKQLTHLESLHAIDQAITSIYDIQVVNNIILDQTCRDLEADAADILILNSPANILEFTGRRGFREPLIGSNRVSLTTSVAGKVLLEGKDFSISNLDENPLPFIQKFMPIENFKSYFARPLTIKGKAVGVMEVFLRKIYFPDEEWNNLFEALTTQAAVAFDSHQKYSDLQKLQLNMATSFRSTLETWSKSLELHDIESHGHIRRVTDETLGMAKRMGIKDEELPNIERGALLHDIGKLAIMDDILQKKGALTDEEWKEIKRHPDVSRELLSNVKMLEDALDIPYSHHENWDGSGYPQGLKGEEIPLAARIFAVVETYDALTSPRPYREAWSKKQAMQYLIDQKEKKYDPKVVDLFLDFLKESQNQ